MLVFLISTIFISCDNDVSNVYEFAKDEGNPSFIIKDLKTYYSDSGLLKVKIIAPELIRFEHVENSYDEYPKGLEVQFFDQFMNITSTLKCQYAKYYIENELWEAKSNVEVENIQDNESLNTELLYWDLKKEIIYSDEFVRIQTNNEIMFGQGFESTQDFSSWRILKPTGEFLIEDDE